MAISVNIDSQKRLTPDDFTAEDLARIAARKARKSYKKWKPEGSRFYKNNTYPQH